MFSESLIGFSPANPLELTNPPTKDDIRKISQRWITRDLQEKHLSIHYSEKYGFHIRANSGIEKDTLLMEYTGEVVPERALSLSSRQSKCLFTLYTTNRSSTRLLVDPNRFANLTRFINTNPKGK